MPSTLQGTTISSSPYVWILSAVPHEEPLSALHPVCGSFLLCRTKNHPQLFTLARQSGTVIQFEKAPGHFIYSVCGCILHSLRVIAGLWVHIWYL
ncbi:hypothetical protein T08_16069 [Trichinella sp. T8]|nr:hypothetical protein T08_16069 [Trichinella sp. T8]